MNQIDVRKETGLIFKYFSFAISFCRFNSICQSICMFLNDNSQMGMHTHTHKPIYMYNYTYVYIYTYKHITHIHTYVRTYILCIHPFLCVNIANDYMPCTAAWSAARQLSVRLSGDPMAPEGSDMTPSGLQQLLETRRYRYLITIINIISVTPYICRYELHICVDR